MNTVLAVGGASVVLRRATADDVLAIVALLAADQRRASHDGAVDAEEMQPSLRAQIEAVRVAERHRSSGVGAAVVSWALVASEGALLWSATVFLVPTPVTWPFSTRNRKCGL